MNMEVIDGKKVFYKSSSRNVPPRSVIQNVYSTIPDDKKIPIVFETKSQYLNEYVKNQEAKKHIKFTPGQVRKYKTTELHNMGNIVSRYTTKHNPYMDPRIVFFTDHKIPPRQFAQSAIHEYGHELWEKNPKIRRDWSVNRNTAPTRYGRTDRQEDFAESLMLARSGVQLDPRRARIIQKDVGRNDIGEDLIGLHTPGILRPSDNPMIVGTPKYFDTRTLNPDIGLNIHKFLGRHK